MEKLLPICKGVSTCVDHDAGGKSSLGGAHQVVPTNGQAPDGHCRDLRVILCPPDWPQVPRLSSFWVCEGFLVSSAVEWVVSVTQVHPQFRRASPGWVGLQPPRVGGLPHGRCLPRADGAHPSAEGLDRTEGGGRWDLPFCTCLSVKLVSSHLLSPGPQASGLGVTHTTCFLGPQSATAARWTSQPPSSQEPSPHNKPPWGHTCPSSVPLETSDCYRG